MPVFVGIDYASRVGAAFLQRYPHSRLDIRLVDDTVHPVNDGFDVVFGTGPLQDSTLIARKVFSLELFLCASPDFVRQLAEPITAPAQLNSLPFIDFGFSGGPRKLTVAKHKRRYELSPMVRARANSFQVCKQYILRGARRRRDAEPDHLHRRVARRHASCRCCRSGVSSDWTCT